jgi:hypothetical protein
LKAVLSDQHDVVARGAAERAADVFELDLRK